MDGAGAVGGLKLRCCGQDRRDFRFASRLFEGLQIRQQVVNLIGIELKFRHGRMAGLDALGERLSQGFDRITLVQSPERRRDLERALAHPVDGVTSRAIVEREGLAALLVG